MTEDVQDQQPQKAIPPPPSYRTLGFGAKFVELVKQRQQLGAKISVLKGKQDEFTTLIKAAFIQSCLGVTPDPKDEDEFKTLATAAGEMEQVCRVLDWAVGVIPGGRASINETKLRLKLTDYSLSMEQIDEIVTAATEKSTWGEISIKPIDPTKGKKKKAAKGKPAMKKVAKTVAKKAPAAKAPAPKPPAKPVKAPAKTKQPSRKR